MYSVLFEISSAGNTCKASKEGQNNDSIAYGTEHTVSVYTVCIYISFNLELTTLSLRTKSTFYPLALLPLSIIVLYRLTKLLLNHPTLLLSTSVIGSPDHSGTETGGVVSDVRILPPFYLLVM